MYMDTCGSLYINRYVLIAGDKSNEKSLGSCSWGIVTVVIEKYTDVCLSDRPSFHSFGDQLGIFLVLTLVTKAFRT